MANEHSRNRLEIRDTDRRATQAETEAAAKAIASADAIRATPRGKRDYDPEDEMSLDLIEPLELPRPSKLKLGIQLYRLYRAAKKGTRNMKGSWQTTAAGIVGTIGIALSNADGPAWLHIAGQVLMGAAALWAGASARDNKVSSEEAGAKK